MGYSYKFKKKCVTMGREGKETAIPNGEMAAKENRYKSCKNGTIENRNDGYFIDCLFYKT